VERAVLLSPGTAQARRGMWWLSNISIRQMSGSFNLKDNIFKLPDAPQKPASLSYFSPNVGDLFARTSWDTIATWMHVKAGLFNQSHAHQDQGSFSLYNKTWLAVTENIHTHSGIEQAGNVHNVLLFVSNTAGDTIDQRQSDSAATLAFQDDGATLTAYADLSVMYRKDPRVKQWRRCIGFNRPINTIIVCDTFLLQTGVSAVWQLNTPLKPIVQGDSLTAGSLVVKPLDADAQARIVEWNTLQTDAAWKDEFSSGWKIELTRPLAATTIAVRLTINEISTWKPLATQWGPEYIHQKDPVTCELSNKSGQSVLMLRIPAVSSRIVSVQLFDCRGRRAFAALCQDVKPGLQTIAWRIPALCAGAYYARVTYNGMQTTKRLVLR
jgi:hypothetical protein